MDNLILSFTPTQHKKYLEIASSNTVLLNFDIPSIEIKDLSIDNRSAKTKMISACEKIFEFSKNDSFFVRSLSREQIKALIPVYYDAVSNIERARAELNGSAIAISQKIVEIDTALTLLHSEYSDFLPYKAALAQREEFKNEIINLDNQFKFEISNLNQSKSRYALELESISSITDIIIPEFFAAMTKASDAPRFKEFKDKEFFTALESFIEKIRTK